MCKIVFFKKDIEEKFNMRRAWFVRRYRLVDAKGIDLVQPWFCSLRELKAFVKTKNGAYKLLGEFGRSGEEF